MVSSITKILAVDDDPKFLGAVQDYLKSDYEVITAADGPAAMKAIAQSRPELILLDFCLPQMTGLELLKIFKRRFSDLPVVMLTAEREPDTIIETMKAGANDYVIKGTEDFEANLKFRIGLTLERAVLLRRNRELKDENLSHVEKNQKLSAKVAAHSRNYEILGNSAAVLKLKSNIERFKGTNPFILITGENGTGKELVARALNAQEDDPARPFIAVNCAAIAPTLFESEFFGHVKGAFTSAMDNKVGQFKLADGGDIFLDEVGEIPIEMQAKLLRVLQEQTFTPVGAVKPVSVNVRVIAATNRDLQVEIRKGRFREDLFYRLNQINLHVPPLRERPEDILVLADAFLKRALPMAKLSEPVKKILVEHSWRGNIRELQNAIECAVVFVKGSTLAFCSSILCSTMRKSPNSRGGSSVA